MSNTCKTCKYWRRERYDSGDCCIRAPWVIAAPYGHTPYTWWPRTLSDQGCGEHQPKVIDNPTD